MTAPFEDPELGTLTWASGAWEFEAGPVGWRPVVGLLIPGSDFDPFATEQLVRIRQTVAWVRDNDLAIRQHIANEMWYWWFNEYSDPPDRELVRTLEQFRDTLTLEIIRFDSVKTDGRLIYADHDLVCNYGIEICVSPNGQFTRGPEMG